MNTKTETESIHRLSVIVPNNPFAPAELQKRKHCLCALNVEKLMEWWPGTPHSPHRDPKKVKAIQRALDWKRVTQIAAYLLQREIIDAPEKVDAYFRKIYEPKKSEPGREWPPRISKVIGFERSDFPTFSNILLHVNGARIEEIKIGDEKGAAHLIIDEKSKELNLSVIDGQHRINGAYLAVKLLQEEVPGTIWEIPAEIFLGLDLPGEPPRRQAQIFIDVNFYQKKVDRSLVADLFPTARGQKEARNTKERAQDIGRKLMLETGPLVGMIQIPGVKYGVKDVITLATLNGAIEDVLEILEKNGIESLEEQTEFLAQCLSAWFEASGRFEDPRKAKQEALHPENVVYQGRVLVSVITLVPAMIWKLKQEKLPNVSERSLAELIAWLHEVAKKGNLPGAPALDKRDRTSKSLSRSRARRVDLLRRPGPPCGPAHTAGPQWLYASRSSATRDYAPALRSPWRAALEGRAFISKESFKARGYLGSGGIGRFRDTLWAAVIAQKKLTKALKAEKIAMMAEKNRETVFNALGKGSA